MKKTVIHCKKHYFRLHAFSLAEMMVVMLILCVIVAAAVPIITKKTTASTSASGSGSSVPVGTVIIWPSTTLPAGQEAGKWLICNGQSTSGYPDLAAIVGTNVPNYQGMFLRGFGSQAYSQVNGGLYGTTSTTYSSGTFGTIQGDAIRNITAVVAGGSIEENSASASGAVYISGSYPGGPDGWSDYGWRFDASRVVPVANEIRPVNRSVNYIIRAKA